MKPSVSKTQVMVLSRNPGQCTLRVGGVPLERVEKFKYLGVWFSSDGRHGDEIDDRIAKASTVLRELWRTVVARSEVFREAKTRYF